MRLKALCFVAALSRIIPTFAQNSPKDPTQIFAQSKMAVVRVEVARDSSDPNSKASSGSGFLVGTNGFVVTAKHVLTGYVSTTATPITVQIGSLDAKPIPASEMDLNSGIDATLLKLRDPAGVGLPSYDVLPRGDSSSVKPGEELFIMGFNLSSSLSIVKGSLASNFGGGACGNLCWEVVASGAVFGMSGAPVLDNHGRVVGMVVGGQPGTNIVFVYPEQLLQSLAITPGWSRVSEVSPPPQLPGNGLPPPGKHQLGLSAEIVPWMQRNKL